MFNPKLVEEFTARMSATLAQSPASDIEKNLRAALAGLFAKLDLVTREEFDVQTAVLLRAQERLAELETRLARLEAPPAQD
ncbi:MAG: accessory factor UbiK family protein [Betaproteobacteria bacterium]|nr:accessory factor UbiK family protein [Betaproteobacteria bacterium]